VEREQKEMELKMKLDDANKVSNEFNQEAGSWKNERASMQQSIH